MSFCIVLSAICNKAIESANSLKALTLDKDEVSSTIKLGILECHFSSSYQI